MDGVFELLHPVVAQWCVERLGTPTPPQAQAIPLAQGGGHSLICSPTGTGKTLAAFLPVMSRLAQLRDDDELISRTFCIYVSPLRALGYDVEHNLRRPLREMGLLERPNTERARVRRGRLRESFVRTGVRTGDTPVEERRLMMSRPPHILLTTPESLALMVAMESYRKTLSHVETVIVDEVHALAGNKRGAHLALVLETLAELTRVPLRRVGLSATVSPLDLVASFVAGTDRDCAVVDCRGLREITLDVAAPFAGAMASLPTCARTAYAITRDERSTLVFTNVRSQAERVAHEMEAAGEPAAEIEVADNVPRETTEKRDRRIGVHHSALERSVRHRTEAALRAGTLRTVVCSSSLELGLDIGYVDRVIIIGGARGMTSTLQRVGRAGHRPGAVAHGTIIAQDRDDIIEAAATRRCIRDGIIEDVAIPHAPLDVLAQWLVGQCAPDRRVPIADALALARQALPFRDLREDDLRACAAYLSGGGAGPDEAHVRRIGSDDDALYGLGREASAAYFENIGTIPDESSIAVSGSGGAGIGRLGEGFAATLTTGDVFLLEGRTLRVTEVSPRGLRVEPYAGRPTVPQWSSHLKGVPLVLARAITALRCAVADALTLGGPSSAFGVLETRYGLKGAEAAHVVRHIAQQLALSRVPDERHPIVEIYRMDERQTAVFHTCAGRRVNETLARIVGARLHRRMRVNSTLTTDDNGFLVALTSRKRIPDAVWASLLHVDGFDDDLIEGLRAGSMLRTYFRHVANTGLLVLRRAGGRSIRGGALRWNAAKIFDRLWEADRHFPLVRETLRVVTRDLLDAPAAFSYLEAIDGEPRVLHPAAATPFTFGIITSSFGDSVVMDDRSAMVEALHERVLAVLGETALPDTPGDAHKANGLGDANASSDSHENGNRDHADERGDAPNGRAAHASVAHGSKAGRSRPAVTTLLMRPQPASASFELVPGIIALPGGFALLAVSGALLCADAHLGYEDAMGGGAALPLWSTTETVSAIALAARQSGAREIIFLGDAVHSTTMSDGAARSVREALDLLRADARVTIVAGNHEGRSRGVAILGATVEACERDGWSLVHGDRPVLGTRTIIGHLHPSIHLGGRVTAPAFIAGPMLVVVPALTPYSPGLDVMGDACRDAIGAWGASRSDVHVVAATADRVYPFGMLSRLVGLRSFDATGSGGRGTRRRRLSPDAGSGG